MLDYLIKGATIVDGTGAPGFVGDVGVRDGRIVAVGDCDEEARSVLDATGLVVCPGFVDPHTHYDAQILWDPQATPSNVHGVTSIIAGNCGFTLAPIKPQDADYTRRMMAKVEGMPLAALENGIDWNWHTFGEYLDRIEGGIGVNAGFLVGHCALRRYVMGSDAVGHEATAEQLDAMVGLLRESIAAGGLGFSTTMARTHSDGDGQPVASRWATPEELVALCGEVGRHEGTTLEGIVDGCLEYFSDDEIDLLVAMSTAARRPINWNVLTVDSRRPDQPWRQLEASSRAAAAGGRIVALTMPVLVPMNMSFLNYCALNMLPGWGPILGLPVPERMEALRDPETRRLLASRADSEEAGVFRRLADFARYVIGDTYAEVNDGLSGRVVADIAAERGQDPFDTLVEIVLADDLRTILWPMPTDNDPDSWALRQQVWADGRAMLGGSDAGAHLDRMSGAEYTTRFLADCLRGRKLVPLERAVQMLTDEPARLFGLRDRGRVAPGWCADLVVFDPEAVGADHARLVDDLPGGTARLTASAHGVVRVLVNGVETVVDNEATGALPGTVLRSGRDTETVATS
ncbi:MAG: amidohydrolase family protein [Acidimicrobiales bacterium]|jgi:N-acyl-D-aspartate/D-glutamate deacylase|nr:amidohydrolase family protein [Acidimicrobiales bacterium]